MALPPIEPPTRAISDGVGEDGKKTHGVWTGKTDGKAYPVKGNLTWDMMAYKIVDEWTYDIKAMKNGKMAWTGRSAVTKDGKSRTLHMSGTGAYGKKFKATIVYDKGRSCGSKTITFPSETWERGKRAELEANSGLLSLALVWSSASRPGDG